MSSGLPATRQALTLFDEMIDMLAGHALSLPPLPDTVPGAPLPGLLEHCRRIAARPAPPLRLLVLRGLAPLDPGWWQGLAPGVQFWSLDQGPSRNVPPQRETLPGPAALLARQEELAREGRDLVLLEPLELAPDQDSASGPAGCPGPLRLLLCHPWQAHELAQSRQDAPAPDDLEGFSAALLHRLEALAQTLPMAQFLRCEEAQGSAAEQAAALLGRPRAGMAMRRNAPPAQNLARSLSQSFAAGGNEAPAEGGAEGPALDYQGGAPAYELLCARLGYAPGHLPSGRLPAPRACRAVLPPRLRGPGAAQISWILHRLEALLGEEQAATAARLLPMIDAALGEGASPEAFDQLCDRLEPAPETPGKPPRGSDLPLAMMLAAAHHIQKQDKVQALGLLTEALEWIGPQEPGLTALASSLYLDLDKPAFALETLAAGLLAPGLLGKASQARLEKAIGRQPSSSSEHGQDLLLARLRALPPLPVGRKRLMVEIGTTRENVPGQGSTRKLALLCAEYGLDFVTVDMDPSNSHRARRMFRRLGLPFQAITSKGEDYLAAHPGPIDYVFLDAYDFDHGNHSELRQSRYEQYIGARISDAACHQMHLSCVEALLRNLAADGLICFDDTWTDEDGLWTAKGKTAMPFLLENGFEVIEARNRAALLQRRPG